MYIGLGLTTSQATPGFHIPTTNLAALYDATKGVTSSATAISSWADQSGNARNLLQATGAAQPIYLRHTGINYGYLTGLVNAIFQTANATANQITGDIDVRFAMDFTALPPAVAYGGLGGKMWSAGLYSWGVQFAGPGSSALMFRYSLNGNTVLACTSTVGIGTVFSAGTIAWIRITRNATTGNVTFYTSVDGGATWNQLGAVVAGTAGALFLSTSLVSVGAVASGASSTVAKVYRMQIWNGIEGSGGLLAVDFNPQNYTTSNQWYSSTTGELWQFSGSLTVCTASSLWFNGTSHFLKAAAFTLNQPETIYLVGKQVTWTAGDYLLDGNTANTGALIQTTATPQLNISAGTSVAANTGATLNTNKVIAMVFNGASSLLQINNGTATTGNAGAGNMGGITLGASGGNLNFGNFQGYELVVYSAAHDAATRSYINAGLMNKYGI